MINVSGTADSIERSDVFQKCLHIPGISSDFIKIKRGQGLTGMGRQPAAVKAEVPQEEERDEQQGGGGATPPPSGDVPDEPPPSPEADSRRGHGEGDGGVGVEVPSLLSAVPVQVRRHAHRSRTRRHLPPAPFQHPIFLHINPHLENTFINNMFLNK